MRLITLLVALGLASAAFAQKGKKPRPAIQKPEAENAEKDQSRKSSIVIIDRRELIRRASENPQVMSTHAEVLRARAQLGQVNEARYPSVVMNLMAFTSLQAENTDNAQNGARSRKGAYRDFSLDQVRPGIRGDGTVALPLYTFGKIGYREEAARAAVRAGEAQTALTRNDVIFAAADIYESYLLAAEIHLFLQEIKRIGKKSIEETRARLKVGDPDTRRGDLLRLKTSMALAETIENQVVAGMAQAKEGLRAYLNIGPHQTFKIKDDVLKPVSDASNTVEAMISLAMDNRPEFAALTSGIEAYSKLSQAYLADYYPDFFAGGYLTGAYTYDRDWLESRYVFDPLGHFLGAAGVGMRWSIDAGGATYRAEEVMADVAKLQGLLDWAKQGIPAEVNKVYHDLKRARKDVAKFEEALPLAREWLLRSTTDFSTGLGPSYEVTDAVTQFVLLTSGRLDAIYRVNRALAELAKVTGTLIGGESPLYPGKVKS